MVDIPLKHYKKYVKKIELFAFAIGVKIIRCESDDDGIWLPWTRVVKISENMSEAEEIATLLHELGHAIDDIITPSGRYAQSTYRAYRALYKNKQTKRQLKIVLAAEKKAWKYGRDIANRLRIRLGRWYNTIEEDSLESYKNS